MWKYELNSDMVLIYFIDVLGLLIDGFFVYLFNLVLKFGLGICFFVCDLKNVGEFIGFIILENYI